VVSPLAQMMSYGRHAPGENRGAARDALSSRACARRWTPSRGVPRRSFALVRQVKEITECSATRATWTCDRAAHGIRPEMREDELRRGGLVALPRGAGAETHSRLFARIGRRASRSVRRLRRQAPGAHGAARPRPPRPEWPSRVPSTARPNAASPNPQGAGRPHRRGLRLRRRHADPARHRAARHAHSVQAAALSARDLRVAFRRLEPSSTRSVLQDLWETSRCDVQIRCSKVFEWLNEREGAAARAWWSPRRPVPPALRPGPESDFGVRARVRRSPRRRAPGGPALIGAAGSARISTPVRRRWRRLKGEGSAAAAEGSDRPRA